LFFNFMNDTVCYTIGHSQHSYDDFFSLLKKFSLTCLVDVRTYPYSKYVPRFNKKEIETEAVQRGFKYIYAGSALGGRYTSPELLFPDGSVDYKKVSTRPEFRQAIEKLAGICRSLPVVLFCAEQDPLTCHRFILDGRALLERGLGVLHISAEGRLLDQSCWERETVLAWQRKNSQYSFFQDSLSRKQVLDRVYADLAVLKST